MIDNCLKLISKFALSLLLSWSFAASALEDPNTELEDVGVFTRLGAQVDLGLSFQDSDGANITLGDVAAGKPLIVVPAYYGCPRLCGLVLGGTLKLLNSLSLTLGHDYNVAVVSFDPAEGPKEAALQAERYHSGLKNQPIDMAKTAFRFLTGTKESVNALLSQLKFNVKKDGDEYAHTSAIMILTPQGKISQYFSGIEFSSFDTRLALVEASHGSVGNPLDHVFLYCFRFDPKKGKYTWAAFNLMRVAACLTLAFLVLLVVRLVRSQQTPRPL